MTKKADDDFEHVGPQYQGKHQSKPHIPLVTVIILTDWALLYVDETLVKKHVLSRS